MTIRPCPQGVCPFRLFNAANFGALNFESKGFYGIIAPHD